MATPPTLPTTVVVSTPAIDLLLLLHQYNQLRCIADTNIRSSTWNITKARHSSATNSIRSSSNSAYSVNDVREELTPTAVLEYSSSSTSTATEDVAFVNTDEDYKDNDNEVPNLVADPSDDVEDNKYDNKDKVIVGGEHGEFVLHFDGMETLLKQKQLQQHSNKDNGKIGDTNLTPPPPPLDDGPSSSNNNEGLRHRRRGGGKQTNESEENSRNKNSQWVTENNNNENNNNNEEDDSLPTSMTMVQQQQVGIVDPIQLFGIPPPTLRIAQTHSRLALGYYIEVANLVQQMNTIMK
jgi:hypothetical protein